MSATTWRVLVGDVRAMLATEPDTSVARRRIGGAAPLFVSEVTA